MKSIFRIVGLLAMLATTGLLSQMAFGQTWNYRAYNSRGQTFDGIVVLDKKGDGYTFQRELPISGHAHQGDADCVRGAVDAAVDETPDTLTITPKPAMAGCPHVRYVIKKDGSGGYVETMHGADWKRFDKDVLLTLKK